VSSFYLHIIPGRQAVLPVYFVEAVEDLSQPFSLIGAEDNLDILAGPNLVCAGRRDVFPGVAKNLPLIEQRTFDHRAVVAVIRLCDPWRKHQPTIPYQT